jgi:hypothetical protein
MNCDMRFTSRVVFGDCRLANAELGGAESDQSESVRVSQTKFLFSETHFATETPNSDNREQASNAGKSSRTVKVSQSWSKLVKPKLFFGNRFNAETHPSSPECHDGTGRRSRLRAFPHFGTFQIKLWPLFILPYPIEYQCQRIPKTLTPVLSHRMGEGESLDVATANDRSSSATPFLEML